MGKQSPFQALVDRQLEESVEPLELEAAETQTHTSLSRSGDHSPVYSQTKGKSSSPEYQRLTVYLKRETILYLKRRIVGTNVELSDIVQDAIDQWTRQMSK